MRKIFLFSLLGLASLFSYSQSITVDMSKNVHAISPLIYGNNGTNNRSAANMTASRLGGNRLTGYNWETNASNGGADYDNSSDANLVNSTYWLTDSLRDDPGALFDYFRNTTRKNNQLSAVTLQMAGFVSADMAGTVSESDAAPSTRWHYVKFSGSGLSLTPDISDDTVYMDQCVNRMKAKLGTAADSGINAYILDNEPDLWSETHSRLHPLGVTVGELFSSSLALSSTVKSIDSSALVIGPTLSGWKGLVNLNSATDWSSYSSTYEWFTEAYLDFFHQKSDSAGRRLLDVFNINWYPQVTYDGYKVFDNDNDTISEGLNDLRLQAPRSLWDTTYTESSWIMDVFDGGPIALIPRLQSQVDQYYPGTKLAITEFQYGAIKHYSGGLAIADVLGIFGRQDVYMANIWESARLYVESAYKLYRDYDGYDSKFGNVSVAASSDDNSKLSVFASVDSLDTTVVHLIVINKSEDPISSSITINGIAKINYKTVYGFGEMNKDIAAYSRDKLSIAGNSFTQELNAHTAYHILLFTGSNLGPDVQGDQLTISDNMVYGSETTTATLVVTAAQSIRLIVVSQDKCAVDTLAEKQFEPGTYTYTIDAAALGSGNYVVKAIYDTTTLMAPFAVRSNTITLSKSTISTGYTTLTLAVERAGSVKITVLDSNGTLIKTVFDGEREVGTKKFYLWADSLPAGVVTIKLESSINDQELSLTVSKTGSSSVEVNKDAFQVSVYPNPADEYLGVRIVSGKREACKVTIKNLIGKELYSACSQSTEISIPLRDVAPGLYILTVEGGGETRSLKVNVQR